MNSKDTFQTATGEEQRADHQSSVAAAARSPAFRILNVAQTFERRGGIEIAELNIRRGSVTAILGRSGTGKSTLLNLIGGMVRAEAIDGRRILDALVRKPDGQLANVDILRRGWTGHFAAIGFVFQHPFLLRQSSGFRNLAMSLAAAGRTADLDHIERFWTESLRMPLEKGWLPIRDLSGGMQQRVAVGRALIRNPQILLADEPTANLDPKIGGDIIEGIVDWQRAAGEDRTVIIVTHDVRKAAAYADDVIVLDSSVVDQRGTQVKPGRLLDPAGSWPRPAPRDENVILGWMQSKTDAAPPRGDKTIVVCKPHASATLIVVGEPREGSEAGAAADRDTAKRRTSPVTVWACLGLDVTFSGHPPSRMNVVNRVVGSALWLAPLATAVCLWIFGGELTHLLGSACVPIVAPFALMAVIPTIAWSTILRMVMFTSLMTLGIAAVEARSVISTFMEDQLNRPDLQPLLVSRGNNALKRRELDTVADSLAAVAGKGRRQVFGRAAQSQLALFLPQNSASSNVPDCSVGRPREPQRGTAFGVEPEERFLFNLDWSPLELGDSTGLAERAWKHGIREDAAPSLALDGTVGRIYLVEPFIHYLGIRDDQAIPKWICMSDYVGFRYAPYLVAAVIRYLPLVNNRQFDIVASCDTLAKLRGTVRAGPDSSGDDGRVPTCGDDDFVYDYLAIRLSREPARNSELAQIKLLSDQGVISAETGFRKVQEASVAASTAAGIGSWFVAVTIAIMVLVTLFSVWQFINENRQPLAVARAFGAKFRDIAVLIGVSLVVPAVTALSLGLLFSLGAIPQTLQYLDLSSGGALGKKASDLGNFWQVAEYGLVIVVLVFFGVLGWWWCISRSHAAELQEVG